MDKDIKVNGGRRLKAAEAEGGVRDTACSIAGGVVVFYIASLATGKV